MLAEQIQWWDPIPGHAVFSLTGQTSHHGRWNDADYRQEWICQWTLAIIWAAEIITPLLFAPDPEVPLSSEEGRRLGVDDVVNIYRHEL